MKGYTGADIEGVVREAAILALREDSKATKVTQKHFDKALEEVSPSVTEDTVKYYAELGKNVETFEVDSIELATPELFFNKGENNSFNQDNNNETELKIFESSNSEKETVTKEPEMFKESNSEEDFEIPAFLRRQKN